MNQRSKTEEDIYNNAIENVLAPALNGFVVWTLKQAMENNIERLYFLARDGYLMYKAAMVYVKHYKLPIECRYLYCSRYSVRIPSYHTDEEKALKYITLGGTEVTPENIYRRAGLNAEQSKQMHNEKILPYGEREQIPGGKLTEIKKILENNGLFLKYMRENSRNALPAYEKYLKQEGLSDEIPLAIADSGWVGSMQKELEQSLRRLGRNTPLIGFYWGLYDIPQDMMEDRYHTYFFSPKNNTGRKAVFNNCLFEAVFTAPHGMTLAYKEIGEKTVPVLSSIQEEQIQRVSAFEERFAAWQDRLFKQESFKQTSIETFDRLAEFYTEKRILRAMAKNLESFMHNPTKEEAKVFGKMYFTDDVLEINVKHISADISMRKSMWYEGSVSIYKRCPKLYIALYTVYRYLLYARKRRRYVRQERLGIKNETKK